MIEYKNFTNLTTSQTNFRNTSYQYYKYCNDYYQLDNETNNAIIIPPNDDVGSYKFVSCASNQTY